MQMMTLTGQKKEYFLSEKTQECEQLQKRMFD